MRNRFRRVGAATGAAVLTWVVFAPPAAVGQVPAARANFRAMSTGTVVHAHALQTTTTPTEPTATRVVDADVAFSGATVQSTGLGSAVFNEFGALVQPALDGNNSYGRGFGLDVGIAQEAGSDDPAVRLAALAEAVAPPQTGPVEEQVGPVDADPLAYASLLRGVAYADWANPPCIIGADFSFGLGSAANAEVIDLGAAEDEQATLEQALVATNADTPEREVSWSLSHNFFTAQVNAQGQRVGNALAVAAETRQTIAPVTLLEGTEAEFTIEFLGEWVLRAVATGIPGTAHVHYGPGEVSPETPILRIIQNDEVQTVVNFQDLLGNQGLVLDLSPVVRLALAEDPRAIGGGPDSQPTIAADGTHAAAAVDVLRVELLNVEGLGEAAEVRVGHMEVSATAPRGGVSCQLPVAKTASPDVVQPGQNFTYTITVSNPFSCTLTNVKVVDDIDADPGIVWEIVSTDPQATSVSRERIVWDNVGPIPPGESRSVRITVRVGENSAAGLFHDLARATAECISEEVTGEVGVTVPVNIPVTGEVRIDLPEVGGPRVLAPPAVPPPAQQLPRTGGPAAPLVGLSMLMSALALRRRGR